MWNEMEMERRPEDGRNQVLAWIVAILLFVGLMAVSVFACEMVEPPHSSARSQVEETGGQHTPYARRSGAPRSAL